VHTRTAYLRAYAGSDWCRPNSCCRRSPRSGRAYFSHHPAARRLARLHLAAIRCLFDLLVTGMCGFDPAASVRGERYQVMEGKTRKCPSTGRGLSTRLRRQACQEDQECRWGQRPGTRRALLAISSGFATGPHRLPNLHRCRAGARRRLRRRHSCMTGAWSLRCQATIIFPDQRQLEFPSPSHRARANDNYFSRSGRQSGLPCGTVSRLRSPRRVNGVGSAGRNPERDNRPTVRDGLSRRPLPTVWGHFTLSDTRAMP